MHDSRTVANRFLALARESGDTLTPMQLIKLVYIAHGWMLGLYGRPLIHGEVQAWQYGPVIRTLYGAARQYGAGPVTADLPTPPFDRLDAREDDIVRQVYEAYGHLSGTALSRLTHATGTPWQVSYVPGEMGTSIPQDLIEEHYKRLSARQMN